MRVSASFLIWSSVCAIALSFHQRALDFAAKNTQETAGLVDAEHAYRHVLIPAQRDGGRVHHRETLLQHLTVANLFVTLRIRVPHGIAVVYAVNLSCLEHHVGADLHRAQTRGGVGCEKRIAGTGTKDHHAPAFQMPDSAAA